MDVDKKKRKEIYDKAWNKGGLGFRGVFKDLTTNIKSNNTVVDFIKEKVKSIIKNNDYAETVTNFNHPFATRRPTLNTNYYETFNEEHVELVDIKKEPIKKITKIKNNEIIFCLILKLSINK